MSFSFPTSGGLFPTKLKSVVMVCYCYCKLVFITIILLIKMHMLKWRSPTNQNINWIDETMTTIAEGNIGNRNCTSSISNNPPIWRLNMAHRLLHWAEQCSMFSLDPGHLSFYSMSRAHSYAIFWGQRIMKQSNKVRTGDICIVKYRGHALERRGRLLPLYQ